MKVADPDPNGFVIGLGGGLFTIGVAAYLSYNFLQDPTSSSIVATIVLGVFAAVAAFFEVGYSINLRRNEVPLSLKAFHERRYR